MAAAPQSDGQPVPRLTRQFFRRDAVRVARGLLGQMLVHTVGDRRVAGRIVETEAYVGVDDKAAHCFGGRRTQRTETMFADGGTAYVYLNYGIHNLFNVVTGVADDPQAVLIRALEPADGVATMQTRRPKARRPIDLCSGPGKLTAALAIDRTHNSVDLTTHAQLFIERVQSRTVAARRIVVAPRVGIDYAEEWATAPLRFYLGESEHVSVR